MEKIAGPYAHTLAGVLGDKRSTMLDSELQYTVRMTITVINHNDFSHNPLIIAKATFALYRAGRFDRNKMPDSTSLGYGRRII